jgi:acetyl-CoA C-acetyltransferase
MAAGGKVYIDGVAQTVFGKDPKPLKQMLAEVGQQALSGSQWREPDCVFVANYDYPGYAGQASLDVLVANELRLRSIVPVIHVERGSASGALAVELGFQVARDGYHVLVLAGEKMWTGEHDRKRITEETSKVLDVEERKFNITMPTIAALATTEYMVRYDLSEQQIAESFFRILQRNRQYGALNPNAYFKQPVSWETYCDRQKNPWVARPLTKNDCAGTYNGAAAVFLVPYETDLVLSGIRSAHASIRINERHSLTSLDATVDAARLAFIDTNLNPHEIDLVSLHDAFGPVPILAAEDLGLAGNGEGVEFILDEVNQEDRRVLCNRCGGFFSKTHPIAASGTAQLVELVLQMRGENQYAQMLREYQSDLDYGLWFSMHGFGFYNSVGIVEKAAPSVKREGGIAEKLPSRFALLQEKFRKVKNGHLVGMAPLVDPNKGYQAVGIVISPRNKLELGFVRSADLGQLGRKVDIVSTKDGTCFVPRE